MGSALALVLLLAAPGVPFRPLPGIDSAAAVPRGGGGTGRAPSDPGAPCGAAFAACPGVSPALVEEAWTNLSPSQRLAPPPSRGASLVFDPTDNALILFGGCSAAACPAPATTWKYAGGMWSNLTQGVQPPARAYATLSYDSKDGIVLLFGGWAGPGRALNDTWSFLGGSWTNVTNASASPPARWNASAVYDRSDSYVTIFGGESPTAPALNDTWRYILGGWKGTSGPSPPARSAAGFVWDDADLYGVLFGGRNATGSALNDTWTFVHARWSVANLTTGSPPARFAAVFTYYGQDNAAYLFGGTNGGATAFADTWRFAQDRWVNATASITGAPTGRVDAAAMESSLAWTSTGVRVRNGFIAFFGGYGAGCPACADTVRNDTWVYELPPQVTASALPPTVERGEPTVLSATVSGGSSPYQYSWGFGDGGSSPVQTTSHAYAAIGAYTPTITVTDFAGISVRASTPVEVVAGPNVTVNATPDVTDAGIPVRLNATATGGTAPYTVAWSFGDQTTGSGGSVTHAYALPGTYEGNATVTDGVFGLGVAGFSVVVHAELGISAVVPGSAFEVNHTANFSASATHGTGPYAFAWTFGDGANGTGASPGHTYARTGNFTVNVTVTDAVGGSASQNFTVRVTPVPPGGDHGSTPPATFLGLPVGWYLWIGLAVAAVAAFGVGMVLWTRARTRRTPPEGLIAAAAAGQRVWSDEEPAVGDSRSARRQRAGRR